MKLHRFLTAIVMALGAALLSGTVWAQNAGTVNDAFQIAKEKVSPSVQNKVVSLYGIGTPSVINKWYIIFYDPSVASHGRAVLVEGNSVTKTYAANGGKTYALALSFDPSRITSEGPALFAAEGYAGKHHITYDSVTALLNESGSNKPFRWKIGLLAQGQNRGYVYVNALDDSVAAYSGPPATSPTDVHQTAPGLANEVKTTFLGIGGDLQEFFTGERTVDK